MVDKSETARPNGLPYAISAYLIWGFVPVYFKTVEPCPAYRNCGAADSLVHTVAFGHHGIA